MEAEKQIRKSHSAPSYGIISLANQAGLRFALPKGKQAKKSFLLPFTQDCRNS